MRYLAYQHFGLGMDPWRGHHPTADVSRVAMAVNAAVEAGAMVMIHGQRGIGKTHALQTALAAAQQQVVEPMRLDRANLHIGDVQTAIVAALSDERPRHSAEARAGQVRRLLAATSRPLLVIDEAHLLHHATLRALKRLRELSGRGGRRPLPVILVGQSNPTVAVSEVGLRTEAVALAGLSVEESGRILAAVLGEVAQAPALQTLARAERARCWLDLVRLVDECLNGALVAGETQLSGERVAAVLGETRAPAVLERTPRPGAVAAALTGGDKNQERVA